MRQRSSPASTAVLLLASLTVVGPGCSPPTAAEPELRRPVKTLVISSESPVRIRSFPGRVEASRRVELGFQVPGLLVEFPVKEGQKVAQGALIGQLRRDSFEARLASLQGQLDQARAGLQALLAGERPEERLRREANVRAAEARLSNARAEFERSSRLLSSRAISQQAHDITQTAYRVAQEELQAAVQLLEKGAMGREEDIEASRALIRALEAQVVEANIQLVDTRLTAPYDGVIAQRLVEEQQNVQAKQPVVRFQDVEEIEIAVDVPESVMVTDIRRADIVELVAQLSGAPGKEFPVEIKEIAQVADATTQTFQVRVAMQAPPDLQALPGMTATVTATYRRAGILGAVLRVPVSAVLQPNDTEPVVFVVNEDSAVSQRPVKLGSVAGGEVEILEGLNSGDRIAVAGVTLLREGMQVRDLGPNLGGGP